jgi:hypothetical protein
VRGQVETLGRDAGDLRVPEPRGDGQPVDQRAGRAGHLAVGGRGLGRPDQSPQFIHGQRPAVVATVFLRVEAGQPQERVVTDPAVLTRPEHERADGVPAVAQVLERSSGDPERRKGVLNSGERQVGQPAPPEEFGPPAIEFGAVRSAGRLGRVEVCQTAPAREGGHPARPVGMQLGVVRGVAPRLQIRLELVQVLRKRPRRMGQEPKFPPVNQAGPKAVVLALDAGFGLLGTASVRADVLLVPNPIRVRPPHVVRASALP